jgi:hypothetical protein
MSVELFESEARQVIRLLASGNHRRFTVLSVLGRIPSDNPFESEDEAVSFLFDIMRDEARVGTIAPILPPGYNPETDPLYQPPRVQLWNNPYRCCGQVA